MLRARAYRDAGHPNDVGHAQMFRCLDLASLLPPLLSSRMFVYTGPRTGPMADAAVGWFEVAEPTRKPGASAASTVVWRSMNGDARDPGSWVPRTTVAGLVFSGDTVSLPGHAAEAVLTRDATGRVVAVEWGPHRVRWQLLQV